jgi:hypothetical protein
MQRNSYSSFGLALASEEATSPGFLYCCSHALPALDEPEHKKLEQNDDQEESENHNPLHGMACLTSALTGAPLSANSREVDQRS